ncbi:MAG: cellulose synthase subunit BcsC-related outer membrane protein [Pseudomonas sp.]|uniref:cellulose biosynthesis protein BcsC n=1 Tax=Pseudomonas sp. TaxID=306 RepID=UPI002735393C|nr:cellulose biosynthesis protein BcsC [Pseudomonas sp.]MDP3847345.1 cellulose synthase subunit BcsC-related outer membrane protein [Pseudomonas sp.]
MFRHHTLAIGLLAALIHNASLAASDDPRVLLLQQGHFWQAEDKPVRAAEVWKKLLQIEPLQADALYGLGAIALKAQRPAEAQAYLTQLQSIQPVPRQALQLEQDIALTSAANQQLLEQARRFADAEERDKAVPVYRQMFAGRQPQGLMAREFYNTLAFTDAGWNEAHAGLKRLLQEQPKDSILALFLAKHLARREGTRAEGIRALALLSKREEIAGDADQSWRLALTWIGPPNATQAPLFEQFLRAHPDDEEIRELLKKGRTQPKAVAATWQQDPGLARGLKALEAGDQATAERELSARLKASPTDADALGGLGVLRQQQHRLEDAEALLVQAVKQKNGRQWQAALQDVRYWSLLERANKAQAQGNKSQAENLVAAAVKLNPKLPAGRVLLADMQAQAGQLAAAEAGYRQVLAKQPGNADAQRGLISVLTQAGKGSEALKVVDKLPPAEQPKGADIGRLRAAELLQQAKLAELRGDTAGARKALESALRNDPNDAWTRFALARIYLKAGATKEARSLVDGLLVTQPNQPDALFTSALLSVELGEWQRAQATIARIPAKARTADMQKLAKDIEFNAQLAEISALAKRGRLQEARALLARIEHLAQGQPERLAILASAYVDVGEPARGLTLMRQLLAQSPRQSPELLLQYAGVLLKTDQDPEVSAILHDLQGQLLSPAARRQYDDLLFLYRVRQAERLREGGDLVAAYDTLAPALAQRPQDSLALAALARMYAVSGNAQKALEIYQPLLQREPQNAQLQLGAADVAAQLGKDDLAETSLSKALALAPQDRQILTTAAGIYQRLGQNAKAAELLTRVVAQEQREQAPRLAAQTSLSGGAANPFVGLPGQRRDAQSVASNAAIPPPASSSPAATTFDSQPWPVANVAIPAAVPVAARPIAYAERPTASTYAAAPTYAVAPVASNAAAAPAYAWQAPAAQPQPVVASRVLNPFAPEAAALAQPTDPRQGMSTAAKALDDILQERSAFVAQGLSVRSNNSESGMGKITDIEAPFEANIPAGDNRLAVRVTPVSLNAGSVGDEAASRFGSGPVASLANPGASVGSQKAEGVGLAVAFEDPSAGLKADLGTSPLGFLYSTAVGGVSLERTFASNSEASYGVSLSRRSVVDSVLSFAGTEDKRTGEQWGGVTANGGRAQISQDNGEIGSYAFGSMHRLLGNNVESNNRGELGGGVYWYLQNDPDSHLTAGLSMTALSYQENLGYYTLGHGGYFSPQSFFAVGIPVSWAQRGDKFSYRLKGSLGVQHIKQDAADYFPGDAALQAAASSAIGEPAEYDSDSSTGVGYSLSGAGEYQFNSNLFVGGELGIDNAQDYQQLNAGMYLRYMYEDMSRPLDLPVSPYRSPYSNLSN